MQNLHKTHYRFFILLPLTEKMCTPLTVTNWWHYEFMLLFCSLCLVPTNSKITVASTLKYFKVFKRLLAEFSRVQSNRQSKDFRDATAWKKSICPLPHLKQWKTNKKQNVKSNLSLHCIMLMFSIPVQFHNLVYIILNLRCEWPIILVTCKVLQRCLRLYGCSGAEESYIFL